MTIIRNALISACGTYRYTLHRVWDSAKPPAVFIMLNPSTADGNQDDPTVRKCIGFARRWGCGSLTIVNLFAYRATDPKELRAASYPVGPDNELYIGLAIDAAKAAGGVVVCAWGANARNFRVAHDVAMMVRKAGFPLLAVSLLVDGTPAHPLMQPYTTEPTWWKL